MAGNASSADQTTASESTGTSDTAASTDVHPIMPQLPEPLSAT